MSEKWVQLKNGDLVQRAEEFLTQYILSGDVAPGEYLPPEQVLCERLGIGRSTLREAVSILQSKGLVERRHGVGVRVIDRSHRAASEMLQLMLKRRQTSEEDLLEMRRLYEVQAARWAAERATRDNLDAIDAALNRMQSAHATPEEFAQADLEFHLAVARATHNAVLALFVETIRSLLHEAILANLKVDYRPEKTQQYHERVLASIRKREPSEAGLAMANHLDDTEERLRRPSRKKR